MVLALSERSAFTAFIRRYITTAGWIPTALAGLEILCS